MNKWQNIKFLFSCPPKTLIPNCPTKKTSKKYLRLLVRAGYLKKNTYSYKSIRRIPFDLTITQINKEIKSREKRSRILDTLYMGVTLIVVILLSIIIGYGLGWLVPLLLKI